jgi:hypothetical protein
MAPTPAPRAPAPPRPPSRPGGPGAPGGPGGRGGPSRPGGASSGRTRVTRAPSDSAVLAVIIAIAVSAVVSVLLTPKPPTVASQSLSMWIAFVAGLFCCTLFFGLMKFFVQKQDDAGTFSDWNIPISKVTIAKALTAVGWLAGAVNCYLISYDLARAFG